MAADPFFDRPGLRTATVEIHAVDPGLDERGGAGEFFWRRAGELGDEDVLAVVVGCWEALLGVCGEVAVAGDVAAGEFVGEHHRGVEDVGGVVAGDHAEGEFGVAGWSV